MDYSRLSEPHPPTPRGNLLDWDDHVDKMVSKGEMTYEEGESLKRRVRRAGLPRQVKKKSSK